jgi:hypothetical protein
MSRSRHHNRAKFLYQVTALGVVFPRSEKPNTDVSPENQVVLKFRDVSHLFQVYAKSLFALRRCQLIFFAHYMCHTHSTVPSYGKYGVQFIFGCTTLLRSISPAHYSLCPVSLVRDRDATVSRAIYHHHVTHRAGVGRQPRVLFLFYHLPTKGEFPLSLLRPTTRLSECVQIEDAHPRKIRREASCFAIEWQLRKSKMASEYIQHEAWCDDRWFKPFGWKESSKKLRYPVRLYQYISPPSNAIPPYAEARHRSDERRSIEQKGTCEARG